MLLDRIDSQVASERQVAAALIAGGAQGVDLPTVEAARAEFERALYAEPRVVDTERQELLEALGVTS